MFGHGNASEGVAWTPWQQGRKARNDVANRKDEQKDLGWNETTLATKMMSKTWSKPTFWDSKGKKRID
jgi:hypothetical protein